MMAKSTGLQLPSLPIEWGTNLTGHIGRPKTTKTMTLCQWRPRLMHSIPCFWWRAEESQCSKSRLWIGSTPWDLEMEASSPPWTQWSRCRLWLFIPTTRGLKTSLTCLWKLTFRTVILLRQFRFRDWPTLLDHKGSIFFSYMWDILSELNYTAEGKTSKVLNKWLNFFGRIDLSNVWGHVNFYARGAGQAVAQLDVNYGVDYEPFKVSRGRFSIPFFHTSSLVSRAKRRGCRKNSRVGNNCRWESFCKDAWEMPHHCDRWRHIQPGRFLPKLIA